jgi:hypothetical protein
MACWFPEIDRVSVRDYDSQIGVGSMYAICPLAIGCGVYVSSTLALGIWLRTHPSKNVAEITSRIMHFFFFFALFLPVWGWSFLWIMHYDELLGLPAL